MIMITLDEAIEILSRPKTMKGTPQDILEAHDMAITALRQPEIVHCQDCKYGEFPAHNVRCSEFYGAGCYNGFCAWGEKK